jgi:hypothetical protein
LSDHELNVLEQVLLRAGKSTSGSPGAGGGV